MQLRVLAAIAVIQLVFLVAAVTLFERFYFEIAAVAGVILFTPAIGMVGGAVLAFLLGGRDRNRRFTIWAACFLAAYPSYFISRPLGNSVGRQVYFERINRAKERHTRALHEWAEQDGWQVQDASVTSGPYALAILRKDGELFVAEFETDPPARALGILRFSSVERELSRELGVPATLVFERATTQPHVRIGPDARMFSMNLTSPRPESPQWRLVCWECPTRVDLVLPATE